MFLKVEIFDIQNALYHFFSVTLIFSPIYKADSVGSRIYPFNQQIHFFGQKSTAVFTKCHTDLSILSSFFGFDFEPVPTLEFCAVQIKDINSFYDHFPEILNTYL